MSALLRCRWALPLMLVGIGLLASAPAAETTPEPANSVEVTTLWLIGDSTVKNGQGRGDGGLWGWGQLLAEHVNPATARVENRALGGRSSRTYLTEGLWDRVLADLKPGDYVFLQFGHNDGGELFAGDRPRASLKGVGEESQSGTIERTGVAETVRTYGWYLRHYIANARAKGAVPIVLTPVPRNRWSKGRVLRADRDYGGWAAAVAKETGTSCIDLNELVASEYERLGEPLVRDSYFAASDHTHTTRAGAAATAAVVAQAIGALPDQRLSGLILPASRENRMRFSFDTQHQGWTFVPADRAYGTDIGYGFEPAAELHSTGAGLEAEGPMRFSVRLPEGNYRVRLALPASTEGESVTVKAELRRLLVEDVVRQKDAETSCEFVVNIRTPQIASAARVALKPRERTTEAFAWDDRLTLEFCGPRPAIARLEIEAAPEVRTLFLLGDSTVADQPTEPWGSWGQMLPRFFGPRIAVANHAESGETIRSSLGARRIDKVLSVARPGDFVAIQFGHNDMKDRQLDRYRADMTSLVQRLRAAGLKPILITSMERQAGLNTPTLGEYPQTVRDIAQQMQVPLIDLHATSRELYRALGDDLAAAFQDPTHHTAYGAYLLAGCIASGIREQVPELAESLAPDAPAIDVAHPLPKRDWHLPASGEYSLVKPAGS